MKELLGKKYPNLALLILRLAAGGVFAYEGALKFFVWERSALVGYFAGLGFPIPEVTATAITYFEFFGGVLIALGLFTRLLSFFAAGQMVVAAVVANAPAGITAALEVDILLFAVFSAIFLVGGGKLSLMRFLNKLTNLWH
jgi:putative oxidoreductase